MYTLICVVICVYVGVYMSYIRYMMCCLCYEFSLTLDNGYTSLSFLCPTHKIKALD